MAKVESELERMHRGNLTFKDFVQRYFKPKGLTLTEELILYVPSSGIPACDMGLKLTRMPSSGAGYKNAGKKQT